MTTPHHSAPQTGMVQNLRTIREQISNEIKDMTFEQERAYLDQLLASKAHTSAQTPLHTGQQSPGKQ